MDIKEQIGAEINNDRTIGPLPVGAEEFVHRHW